MIIWDDAKQKAVITLEFRSQVNRVCLSRTRIIVALHNSVNMFTFSSSPEKISVFETADNPLGLCCLGSKVVAFPGRTPGQVQMVEIGTGNVSIIPAHSSPLRAMDLSPDGEILATASEVVGGTTAPIPTPIKLTPSGNFSTDILNKKLRTHGRASSRRRPGRNFFDCNIPKQQPPSSLLRQSHLAHLRSPSFPAKSSQRYNVQLQDTPAL